MYVLITGGAGFLGTNLVGALLARGDRVHVLDERKMSLSPEYHGHPNLTWQQGSFLNQADVDLAVHDCDTLFHLASTTLPKNSIVNPVADVENNIAGSLRLFLSAYRAGIKKIIFISSGGTVYGPTDNPLIGEDHPTNPINSYGISKLAVEKYLNLMQHLYGLDSVTLRLSNPFGEHQNTSGTQGAVAVFLYKAMNYQPVEIWGDGSVIRDYVYVGDVVGAMLLAADSDLKGAQIFNIGSGGGMSLNQVLAKIEILLARRVDRIYSKGRKFDTPINILNVDKARYELGWTPKINFDEGLTRLYDWVKYK